MPPKMSPQSLSAIATCLTTPALRSGSKLRSGGAAASTVREASPDPAAPTQARVSTASVAGPRSASPGLRMRGDAAAQPLPATAPSKDSLSDILPVLPGAWQVAAAAFQKVPESKRLANFLS